MALAEMKKFDEAIKLNQNAMLIADSSAQPFNIFQTYTTMGSILKLQNKFNEAIPFFEHGFHSLKEADMYDQTTSNEYAELAECYEKTGNYSKALEAFRKSASIIDSVRSKDNIRRATELTMNYEFDKKQNNAKAIQDKKNEVTKSRQMLLLVGLVLTLIIAAVAWRAFQIKYKANAFLQKQKEEVQDALTKLKDTQLQLIQSEKMASLGELTAGIAHEIQNPLNFVNNFSELNSELLAEMHEEIEKGNFKEAKIIANGITENEEKIIYHGKRADSIVKGMLQHSRGSTTNKEPYDINALADEYLRLTYHGLRAKDKSISEGQQGFNATLRTDFDPGIGKINIVPHDIGRVFLNLFGNAFYSVTEKKKLHPENYEPTVSITTKKLNDKVEIRVADNRNGVPGKILDKIFHPFFTTKPTGMGTGLGLSLSYDIIKSHNGELKVETIEGEGAQFIIELPLI